MVNVYSGMKYNDLKDILKQKAKEIPLNDLYELSFYFHKETLYLPEKYKKEYIETLQNTIIKRLNSLKNDTEFYEGILTDDDVDIINDLLKESDATEKVFNITNIYATYFLKEPIHKMDVKFPGRKNVYKKGKYYYCPVKKYHITDNKSFCKYCIAKIED